MNYLGPCVFYFGQLLAQLSILTTYITRLRFSNWARVITWTVIIVACLNTCTLIPNIIFKTFRNAKRDHGLRILWYLNGAVTLAIDMTIWSLPLPMIMKMQKMAPKEKLKLCLTFSVGLMSCASSLSRLCIVSQASDLGSDLSYTRVHIQVLCTAETGFGVCAVSMVPLRPLLRKICNWYPGTPDTVTGPPERPVRTGAPEQRRRQDSINSISLGVSRLGADCRSIGEHSDGDSNVSEIMKRSLDATSTTTTHHADIELGTIISYYASIVSALDPPPNAVVYPDVQ